MQNNPKVELQMHEGNLPELRDLHKVDERLVALAQALNARVAERWDAIRERVGAILLPARHLEAVLRAAGADLTPEAIHLSRGFYERALLRAREIRDRYTCLDLAGDTGRLASLLPSL